MRICVVGCGAAGLGTLRVLSEEIPLNQFDIDLIAYERTDSIGGVWNYDKDVVKEFASPMYSQLRTNLPKEVMSFPDFPFPNTFKCSFIHHTDVLKYLKLYAEKYNLEKFVKFNSNIRSIQPFLSDGETKWRVSLTNTHSRLMEEKVFDAVIVANGHFDKTHIPSIEGIEHFKGELLHSKYYRVPEEYQNKIVFILGARNSGIDLAFQLSNIAKKVYLSHKKDRLQCKKIHELVHETRTIVKVDIDGHICTADGSKYEADVIIFCTGYEISLEFLSDLCKIKYDNSWIRPLYKHLISPYYPNSLFFIGFGYEITPFTFFYMQSKVVRSILQNCAKELPGSTDAFLECISKENEEYENNGTILRHRHYFNKKQWPYYLWCERVAKDVMTATIPPHFKNVFEIIKKWRSEYTDLYREIDLEVSDENAMGFIIRRGPPEDFYSADFENCLNNVATNNEDF